MKQKRWIYGAIGVLVLLFAGLVYAWSVLASPIKVFFQDWSSTKLSFTFTLCMMFFCLGGLLNGLLSERISPKITLKASAVLFISGFFLASKAESIIALYVGYGILAGLASGLAYNSIMGNITKFFPDCPGLISGVLLMGFGVGSFIIGKVYQITTPSGEGIDAWRNSFVIFGVILFVIIFVCSFFIRRPIEGEIREITKDIKEVNKVKKSETIDVEPAKMIRKSSFWIFFLWILQRYTSLGSECAGIVMMVSNNLTAVLSCILGAYELRVFCRKNEIG